MKIVSSIIFCLFIFSCSTKKETEKVIAKENDSLTREKDTVLVIDTIKIEEQPINLDNIPKSKDVRDRLIYFKEKYLINYAEIMPEQLKVYVLDRFTSEKKYNLFLEKKISVNYGKVENIFPVINIRAYVFKDSTQNANAINNWFNCFGNDCNTIKVGEETMIKSTPGFYIINPTSIICLDYLVEHAENNWDDVIAHLKALFAKKGSILIKVKPQGKLSWQIL